jgi:hypothetical protein
VVRSFRYPRIVSAGAAQLLREQAEKRKVILVVNSIDITDKWSEYHWFEVFIAFEVDLVDLESLRRELSLFETQERLNVYVSTLLGEHCPEAIHVAHDR